MSSQASDSALEPLDCRSRTVLDVAVLLPLANVRNTNGRTISDLCYGNSGKKLLN